MASRLVFVFLSPMLLALSCHSGSEPRDAAGSRDVAGTESSSAQDSQTKPSTDMKDALVPMDRHADAPLAADRALDSVDDTLKPGDAGSDASTQFQCKFPLANPKVLFCDRGQYCAALSGGSAGSGTTFSCANPPTDCPANLTCECLCGKGGPSGCSVPAYPSAGCFCTLNAEGPVLVCALP